MKVERLIKELQKYNKEAEVKLHTKDGNNVLFVLGYVNDEKQVVLEDKDDSDLTSELEERFQQASENNIDELDFFLDLFESGFTIDDIKVSLPSRYEYSKDFCETHGLL